MISNNLGHFQSNPNQPNITLVDALLTACGHTPLRHIKQHYDAEQGCWCVTGEVETMSKPKYEIAITISEDDDGGIDINTEMNPPVKPAEDVSTVIEAFYRRFVLGIPQIIQSIEGDVLSMAINGEEVVDD